MARIWVRVFTSLAFRKTFRSPPVMSFQKGLARNLTEIEMYLSPFLRGLE